MDLQTDHLEDRYHSNYFIIIIYYEVFFVVFFRVSFSKNFSFFFLFFFAFWRNKIRRHLERVILVMGVLQSLVKVLVDNASLSSVQS